MKVVNRPEDRAKVMVLVPSVIAVLLYFIFGVLPMMAKMKQDATPAPPADPATTNVTAAAPVPEVTTPTPAPQPNSPLLVDMPAPLQTTNDPFKPPSARPATAAELAAAGPGVKPNPAPTPPAQIAGLQAAPIVGKLGGGVVIGPNTAGTPAVVNVAAAPTLTLQGVILAEHSVGVFRDGEQTYYKHIGEVVGDHMVLKQVADSGVVLRKGTELFRLDVGHSDMSPTKGFITAPASTVVASSASFLERAPAMYRATEGAAPRVQHSQQLINSHVAAVVPLPLRSSVPGRKAQTDTHTKLTLSDGGQHDKIIVSTVANETTTTPVSPNRVESVLADGISPEDRNASAVSHKRTRHKRRVVRHGALLKRRTHRSH